VSRSESRKRAVRASAECSARKCGVMSRCKDWKAVVVICRANQDVDAMARLIRSGAIATCPEAVEVDCIECRLCDEMSALVRLNAL
jgi:hypothetical protein